MFLLIFEDGTIRWTEIVSDDDLSAVDSGILSIINMNAVPPLEYHSGEWIKIDPV